MIQYLSAAEILVIHALVIEETSGSHGVRDANLLESIAHRPQARFAGQDIHADLFSKAAALSEALVNYHIFVDGNKRTGFVALARFLMIHGYDITAGNKEIEETMIAIATKKMSLHMLRDWIMQNTKKYNENE